MIALTDKDRLAIAELQRECSLVTVTAEINRYGFWEIKGTHNEAVKVLAKGKIWTPTRNEFREAYYKAREKRMFEQKGA